MKRSFLLALVLIPILANGYGRQDSAIWNFSITPQNLISNCIRFDLERRLSSNNWLGVGQLIYFGDVIENNDSIYGPLSTVRRYNTPHKNDAISGAGWVIEDKVFFNPKYCGYFGPYLSFGMSYSIFNISYQDNGWVPYQQNGATYYAYSITNANMRTDQNDFTFAIGITSNRFNSLHVDVMFGGGLQLTTTTYTGLPEGYRNYSRTSYDFQHEGVFPLIRLQLGYAF